MNKKVLFLTTVLFSSFSYSNDLYSFDSIELEAKVGITDYGLNCDDCDSVGAYSLGLSTDKDYDLFFSSNININESFIYKERATNYYDLDSYSFNVNANYNFYKKENFNFYALGGLSYWKNSSIGMNTNEVFSTTDSGLSPLLGVGINYKLNKNIKVGIEYNYKFKMSDQDFKIKDIDSNSLYLTFSYSLSPEKEIFVHKIYEEKEVLIKSKENYSIFFDIDSDLILQKGKMTKIADQINTYENPRDVIIYLMGHSSKAGEDYHNKILSQKRLEMVKDSLKNELNKDYDIIFESYGEKYASDNKNEQRVDVIIKSRIE